MESFVERLNELPKELDMNWSQMARKINKTRQYFDYIINKERNTNLRTVEKIGTCFNYIPVVFHILPNNIIKDLGDLNFFYEVKIENYVGKVLRKHRLLQGLKQKDVVEKMGLESYQPYSYIESGKNKPGLSKLEKISKALNLVPEYLLPLGMVKPENMYKYFEFAIKALEILIIASEKSIKIENIELAIDSAEKISKLGQALKIKYDILKRKKEG